MAMRSSNGAYIDTMYWVQRGHDGVQPPLHMGHDTHLSPISGHVPDGHHQDVTASWDIPVVYVIIEQLQEKIKLIEDELIELRNMRSMNDTSQQCTASCHGASCQNAMSGLQAGSLIVIKSLQRKIQLLEEELCKRPTETECTKCGAHVESIEHRQADTVPKMPMDYELPTLNVSQNIDIGTLTDDSLLRGQVKPHAASDDLYDENSCESRKSTVLSTGSNTLRDRDETVAMNPESSGPSDDVHSSESLQQNSYGIQQGSQHQGKTGKVREEFFFLESQGKSGNFPLFLKVRENIFITKEWSGKVREFHS